jgi:hypothetical protein
MLQALILWIAGLASAGQTTPGRTGLGRSSPLLNGKTTLPEGAVKSTVSP